MNIIYRKDLTKKRKGYALDDAIKEILSKNKKYDAYFVFDADNILDKNYIKEMINSIEEGYDIGISYRNTKNSSTLVAASSALTFSMINTIGNQLKSKYTNNLTISGTGYYIKGSLVEDWQGFPFNTLTEDYELTLYSTLNNLTTTYNEKAIFYDEQPDSFKISMKQRTRWVKGYFEARKIYIKEILTNPFDIFQHGMIAIHEFSSFFGNRRIPAMASSIITVQKRETHLFFRTIQQFPAFGIGHSHMLCRRLYRSRFIDKLKQMEQTRSKKILCLRQYKFCFQTQSSRITNLANVSFYFLQLSSLRDIIQNSIVVHI